MRLIQHQTPVWAGAVVLAIRRTTDKQKARALRHWRGVAGVKREHGGELRLVAELRQGVCEKYFFPSLPNEVPMLPNAS
jgi:hypothetical protein